MIVERKIADDVVATNNRTGGEYRLVREIDDEYLRVAKENTWLRSWIIARQFLTILQPDKVLPAQPGYVLPESYKKRYKQKITKSRSKRPSVKVVLELDNLLKSHFPVRQVEDYPELLNSIIQLVKNDTVAGT